MENGVPVKEPRYAFESPSSGGDLEGKQALRFTDTRVFREDRLAVGHDEQENTHYLSIPVFNGLAEYEEYYLIPSEWAQEPTDYLPELRSFAEQCRLRKMDDRLIVKPGRLRGDPV